MARSKRLALREEARQMFYHAYEGYLDHAFPADELMPQSCRGRWRFPNGHVDNRGTLDDGFGNYSLTLVDSLDSLVVFGDLVEFERAVGLVTTSVTFDRDVTVNVFETTIRGLGGLLSAHLLAERHLSGDNCTNLHISSFPLFPSNGDCSGYKYGEKPLLDLAVDLANRMLPAFKTQTGIPYSRVNLQYGVPRGETTATCLAGAGTLLLEFGTLSRLTNDPQYEEAAARAMHALWERREPRTDLVGGLIDVNSGRWLESHAGIGAGSDSFYEYLLKSYILFGESSYLHMFNKSYDAIKRYMKQGEWYLEVQMSTGSVVGTGVDSLQAFFPGVQVLTGDITGAVEMHSTFYALWKRYGSLPESFNIKQGQPPRHLYKGYPLRPEFIESTLMLYHATRDPFYLEVGQQIISDLRRTKTSCGFAAVADVETGRLEDRMDSYFLSETCKYLFLLFDEDNEFIRAPNIVFTTEAHILPIFTSSPASSLMHKLVGPKPKSSSSKSAPETGSGFAVHDVAQEVPGTCAAFNTSSNEAGLNHNNNANVAGGRMVNPKAVLSSMFAEYRTEQQRRKEVERKLREAKPSAAAANEAAADFEQELMKAISETLKSATATKPTVPVPQPQLTVETVITVSLWGTSFTVYAASGIQRYQGNLILTVAPAEVNTTDSEGEEGQDTFDYSDWGDDDDDDEEEKGVEVVAVQALFGPFFSAFIGHSFELIYLPHDLCPGQGFHMDPDDSFARVVLVPRGGCNFADKANELRRFRVAGMLVYNTNPDEQALEMTAADMDVPVPSAMVSYADGMALKQALARSDGGVLVMRARADQASEPSATNPAPDAAVTVADIDALRVLLQNHFEQQHNCQGENCVRFLNPGLPIVIDSQAIPKRPAEEADRLLQEQPDMRVDPPTPTDETEMSAASQSCTEEGESLRQEPYTEEKENTRVVNNRRNRGRPRQHSASTSGADTTAHDRMDAVSVVSSSTAEKQKQKSDFERDRAEVRALLQAKEREVKMRLKALRPEEGDT